jgi:CDP-diacylglycerol---serine O-phosphatidyltransferase
MTRMKGPAVREAVADGDLRFAHFLPNVLTVLGLCCGATAIPFALASNWKAAVTAIVLAAIFDTLDGRVARYFGTDTEFGAQLDSLSDLVSFGIAPAMLVYLWMLNRAGGAGWAIALIFCICAAIRLARFMIESPAEEHAEPEPYFIGVPTPAAACLILLPLIISFQFPGPVFANPVVSATMVAVCSLLMVSRMPTLSLKAIHLPSHARGPALGFAGLLLGFAILWPWSTLTACLVIYLVSLPVLAARAHESE